MTPASRRGLEIALKVPAKARYPLFGAKRHTYLTPKNQKPPLLDDVTLDLTDCTCIVGPNGSGKSTVLGALNIFFREQENSNTNVVQLEPEDFHHKNTATPIEITVTFKDLSTETQADFRDYYRNSELTISSIATFNEETGKAEVVQHGQRLAMSAFAPFLKP